MHALAVVAFFVALGGLVALLIPKFGPIVSVVLLAVAVMVLATYPAFNLS